MDKFVLFTFLALLVFAPGTPSAETAGWTLWVGEVAPNGVIREMVSSEDFPETPLDLKAGAYTACFMGDLEIVHEGGHETAFARIDEKLVLEGNPADVRLVALSRLVCVTVYGSSVPPSESRRARFEVEVVTPIDGVITGFKQNVIWTDGDVRLFKAGERLIYVQLSKIRH